ncbi:O-antigen ligase family protein [Jatrophihabitans sp. DSM 45814]
MNARAEGATGLGRGGALPILIAYVIVLMGIPSELILKPLGAAGTPAQIIGIGLFGWWLSSRLVGRAESRVPNPVKLLLLLFVLSLLASYIAGMSRAITFSEEVNSSDRALLSLCAWCGVTLVTIEGITSRRNLDSLLKVVAGGATFIAVLGLCQFFFKIDLAHYIRVPGLQPNHAFGQLLARSSFQRVTGTTSHPIEFGVVLSCALPLVIHYARFSETLASRRRWWIATSIVAAVLPMSVARSAILGAAIVFVYLFYTWPHWLKTRIAIAISIGAIGMSFAVPGLLGTIRGLFLNASSDPSTAGRTADYAPVIRYVSERPWFGRGIGTFIPSIYRTLDNQYLGIAVEAGIVGLVMVLLLFIGTNCVAGSVRRRTSDESTRDLAQSLKAGIAVLAINSATFDTFGFSMASGMIFLLIGAVGALWSIQPRRAPRPYFSAAQYRRVTASAAACILLLAAAAGYSVQSAKPQYQAYGTILLVPPAVGQNTAYAATGRADYAASVLHDVMTSQPIRAQIGDATTGYQVALEGGSLAGGTDVIGTGGPSLRIVATGTDAESTNAVLAKVILQSQLEMHDLQTNYGIDAATAIKVEVLQQTGAFPVYGKPKRAKLGLLLLFATLALATRSLINLRRPASAFTSVGGEPPPRRELVGASGGEQSR